MDDHRITLAFILSAALTVLKFVSDWKKFTAWTVTAAYSLVLIYSFQAPGQLGGPGSISQVKVKGHNTPEHVASEHASLTPKPRGRIVEAEGHARGRSQALGHSATIIAVVGAA